MDTQTSQESWRPVVNGVLYSVQFHDDLTDDLAGHLARQILHRPLAGLAREGQYEALATAVHTGEGLTRFLPQSHAEGAFRDFVARVVGQLDALRPWPEPAYEEILLSRWEDFANPVLIARLTLSSPKVQQKTESIFANLDDIGKGGIVLRLQSGAQVALVSRWWSDSNHSAVFTQGVCEHDVIQELVDVTYLETGHFEMIE